MFVQLEDVRGAHGAEHELRVRVQEGAAGGGARGVAGGEDGLCGEGVGSGEGELGEGLAFGETVGEGEEGAYGEPTVGYGCRGRGAIVKLSIFVEGVEAGEGEGREVCWEGDRSGRWHC